MNKLLIICHWINCQWYHADPHKIEKCTITYNNLEIYGNTYIIFNTTKGSNFFKFREQWMSYNLIKFRSNNKIVPFSIGNAFLNRNVWSITDGIFIWEKITGAWNICIVLRWNISIGVFPRVPNALCRKAYILISP